MAPNQHRLFRGRLGLVHFTKYKIITHMSMKLFPIVAIIANVINFENKLDPNETHHYSKQIK